MNMKKLKKVRGSKGLSQQQLADIVGINVRQYQKYELGEQTPSVERAIDIAYALDTRVEEIWDTKWRFSHDSVLAGKNKAELDEGIFVSDYIEYVVGEKEGYAYNEEGSITFYLEDTDVERLEKYKEEITAEDIFTSAWEGYDSRDWKNQRRKNNVYVPTKLL